MPIASNLVPMFLVAALATVAWPGSAASQPLLDGVGGGFGNQGFGGGGFGNQGFGGGGFGSDMGLAAGSTVQGDVGRGLGVYNAGLGQFFSGLGQFNLETAKANAVETARAATLNEYLYRSRLVARERYARKVAAERERNRERREAVADRINTRPNERDIMDGAALNRILEDLSGYRIAPSILRSRAQALPVELIQGVPYHYPSIGGVISLGRMLPEPEDWPVLLRGEPLASRRLAYDRAVQDALLLARHGRLGLEDIRGIREAIRSLRSGMPRVEPGAEQAAFYQAQVFLNQLETSARTLQAAATTVAIAELDGFHGTTVFELVDFMERFGLRFAPARTPEERELYGTLYFVLSEQRNELNDVLEPIESSMLIDRIQPVPEEPR
ncbi:hypothetical protein [Tautonia plasticadhaerens]|uniref:Outer membrane efflux protein n=1 Tax=Tautonia plasticadhaerens TaxID=2527974 RepID=A0A518GVG5_9BACT|nr:hypothetical protein [Tautonia plasticadhaerens]QDV32583.1 hypothetical protein ElP_04170 [Tautonia plasticadhaerens]